ncbi:Serine/threonine protein kinase [Thermomonospora echinospora]|uniref:Serine/threonine protein kinase n=1 Tax=Thermomonospora echinospora TaxID=1992 RepID=A0A1H6DMQ2_9ACTN|nr:protein kinase [Thermomonospora echinospora]SEG85875.1 Serine/threonine protein kinase [Thermomonospora echinospora]
MESRAEAAPHPGDPRRIGPFTVVARIGAGGMGRVYLARSGDGRTVAVKTVHAELARDPGYRRRFAREVAAARRVGGAFTAQVIDAGPDEETPWMATEYVPAPSLRTLVKECGVLPEDTVRWLAAGIAQALRAIHGAALVHRDLKPGNVLVTLDGPKVIDFGIARAEGQTLTQDGFSGTPGFMAPEQLLAPDTVGPAADVFCLGALLMYAATGRRPFAGAGHAQIIGRMTQDGPDVGPVPAGLRDLIVPCLASDPAHRPTPEQILSWCGPVPGRALPPAAVAVLRAVGRAAEEIETAAATVLDPPATGPGRYLDEVLPQAREAEAAGDAGDAGSALDVYTRLSVEAVRRMGPDHPDTLSVQIRRIHWMARAGDPGEARALADALADRCARLLGPDHDVTLNARSVQVSVVGETDGPARAALLAGEVARDYARLLGPHDDRAMDAQHEQARWMERAGNTSGAAELVDAVVTGRARVLGADHPKTLAARYDHVLLVAAGNLAQGTALARELVTDTERALGTFHPLTLAARSAHAAFAGRAGDPATAAVEYRELVADAVEHLGPHHPDTYTYRHGRAHWMGHAGNAMEAVEGFAALVNDISGRFGAGDPRAQAAGHEMQVWIGQVTQARKASPWDGIRERQRTLGPLHPETVREWEDKAAERIEAKDHEHAVQLCRRLVELYTELDGPEHPRTLGAWIDVITQTDLAGDPHRSVELCARVLAGMRRSGRPPQDQWYVRFSELEERCRQRARELDRTPVERPVDPEAAEQAVRDGQDLERAGDLRGAEAAYRRADELGSGDGASDLGVLLYERHDVAGAEVALRRADRRGNAMGTFRLGVLLQDRGDLTEAETAYRRAARRGSCLAAYNLGLMLAEQDDKEAARIAFEQAAQDPGQAAGAHRRIAALG